HGRTRRRRAGHRRTRRRRRAARARRARPPVSADGPAGRRLDEVVAERAGVSRAEAQRWIEDGRVLVDGRQRPKGWRLRGTEALGIDPPERPPPGPPQPEDLPVP